ncbi:Zinc finger protein [Plakobranchus ocellatus]|uniref:Zinc finger protein n=1 Tax=Plakobranchus ocellatus TaxID=259542 RepID=A0AAV3YFB4_9GAST|nr:Zinc finger protein [Plakobranchus ocellatus]
MSFGMMNSGATLTRERAGLHGGLCRRPIGLHFNVRILKELFSRLQLAKFTLRPTKCVLGARTIHFLGHLLREGANGLQDENVEKFGLH